MLKLSLILIALFSFACSTTKPTPGPGPTPPPQTGQAHLKLNPKSPHYFEMSGKPILIASHGALVPTSRDITPDETIKFLIDNHQIHDRVWHLLPWDPSAYWPWARSTQCCFKGVAGGNKYDLTQWNAEYFSVMKSSLEKIKGIASEIMVFDRCGMSPASEDRWQGNPWAQDNNINGLETVLANADGTPGFYDMDSKPKLFALQRAYVTKLMDETQNYNVFYEIENEHWKRSTRNWSEYWANFIKAKNKDVLVSYSSLEDDLEDAYTISNIDVVNIHYGGELDNNPDIVNQYLESHWHFNKAMNIDEFGNGTTDYNLLRRQAWTIIMSGGHFHIEDAAPVSQPIKVTDSVHKFIDQTGWNFVGSHPQKNWSASGYCMISDNEWACYYPNAGNKTLNLPAGKYIYEWFDTVNGGVNKQVTLDFAGGNLTLQQPFPLDWALHIRRI